MTDPISDMFIRIKNAYKAGHETAPVPYSKFKEEIVKVMQRGGFVGKIEKRGKRVRKILDVALVYKNGEGALRGVNFFSTPARRIYFSYRELPRPKHGGALILTTSKGIMTAAEAKKAKTGGQLMAEVW